MPSTSHDSTSQPISKYLCFYLVLHSASKGVTGAERKLRVGQTRRVPTPPAFLAFPSTAAAARVSARVSAPGRGPIGPKKLVGKCDGNFTWNNYNNFSQLSKKEK